MMTALELVSNRETKAPVDKAIAGMVQDLAYKAGVMVRVSGPNLILSPPLVLSEADAATIIETLDEALTGAAKN